MAEKIKITFLGTGSAIPTKKRNHPAILLQYKDENILFDCGESTQRQFRFASLNPCKLTKIFITHWHADHVLGLPGLFQTLMLNGYNKTLHIYGPKRTQKMIELYKELFVGKGEKLRLEVHELENQKIDFNEFYIESEKMNHNTETLAYSFVIKEKLRLDKNKIKKLGIPSNSPLLGQLAKGKSIEFKGKKVNPKNLIYKEKQRKITIIMDTKINPNCEKLAKDSDLLISESTYNKQGQELAEKHFHLTSEQAALIAKKSKSKKLILTHLSQRNEKNPEIILKEAKAIFKNTELAKDLMSLEL